MNNKVYKYLDTSTYSKWGLTMSKALTVLIAISMLIIVAMPIANAIQTDKIYVGTTGAIGGYNTYDYDAQRYGDYIVWIRALDIYDDLGNVAPDGSVKGEDSFYRGSMKKHPQ